VALLVAVVVTANHYLMDTVGGLIVFCLAAAASLILYWLQHRTDHLVDGGGDRGRGRLPGDVLRGAAPVRRRVGDLVPAAHRARASTTRDASGQSEGGQPE